MFRFVLEGTVPLRDTVNDTSLVVGYERRYPLTKAVVPDADCCAAGMPSTVIRMFHRASASAVCIWSIWVRENVVAPAGITAIVITACCPLPATSGGTDGKDSFVSTSAAAAGDPIRSITAVRNRTIILPEKDIPMMEYAASHR
jgi:hypothetical protein